MIIFRHAARPDVRIQIDRLDVDLFGTRRQLYAGGLYVDNGPARTSDVTAAGSVVPRVLGVRTAAYSERGLTALMYKLVDELKDVTS